MEQRFKWFIHRYCWRLRFSWSNREEECATVLRSTGPYLSVTPRDIPEYLNFQSSDCLCRNRMCYSWLLCCCCSGDGPATEGTEACHRRARDWDLTSYSWMWSLMFSWMWCFLVCWKFTSVSEWPVDLLSVTSSDTVFTRCLVVHRMCVLVGNIVVMGENRNYTLISSEIVLIPSQVTWPWNYEAVQ